MFNRKVAVLFCRFSHFCPFGDKGGLCLLVGPIFG